MDEIILDLYRQLNECRSKIAELERRESTDIQIRDTFPSEPYSNQLVVRTDENLTYRFDSATGQWQSLTG